MFRLQPHTLHTCLGGGLHTLNRNKIRKYRQRADHCNTLLVGDEWWLTGNIFVLSLLLYTFLFRKCLRVLTLIKKIVTPLFSNQLLYMLNLCVTLKVGVHRKYVSCNYGFGTIRPAAVMQHRMFPPWITPLDKIPEVHVSTSFFFLKLLSTTRLPSPWHSWVFSHGMSHQTSDTQQKGSRVWQADQLNVVEDRYNFLLVHCHIAVFMYCCTYTDIIDTILLTGVLN